MSVTLNGSGGLTFNDGSTQNTASLPGMRNRIINGAMMIDQRNAGASLSTSSFGLYSLDRWQPGYSALSKFTLQQNAGSVTPPIGFVNYLGITSSAATSLASGDFYAINQHIEGFNFSDMAWGTANAQPVTISFWVRSSLTGTFGGAIRNSSASRSYPFSYTISSANTWEQKSITIAGDTTGTWLTNNGIGATLIFGIGVGSTYSGTAGAWATANYLTSTGATSVVGTNGATFYITGVQLEKGSTATSFDYRPYGTELALCQRYYYRITPGVGITFGSSFNGNSTLAYGLIPFPVVMRTGPSGLEQNGTANNYAVTHTNVNTTCSVAPVYIASSAFMARVQFQVASGLTTGQGSQIMADPTNGATAYLGWSAEL